MPNIPKALLSRDIKTLQGSGWQDQMHGSLHERHMKHYYHGHNGYKQQIVLGTYAAVRSTVHHRRKSLNTNGHCAQTNRQKRMVDRPK